MGPRSIRRFACALAVAGALGSPATGPAALAAGPVVKHATMRYYAVGGTTTAQIRTSLDARAPKSPDGFNGDAFTQSHFHWNWPGYGTSTCDLAKASVTLTISVSFPRWTHPKAASAAVAAAWARYAKALATHEQGHADVAYARYPAVVRAIKRATCATADAAAHAQLDLMHKQDVAYDARTNHGATQGARFP
jgi:predicted secreted Zn-dependent protease